MEFWITIVGLLRRPRVVIPAVLAAVALGALAYLVTPLTYSSSTTMVLTTTEYGGSQSQDPTTPTALTNPLLNFSDSLRTTSAILIQAMGTEEVADELGARPPTELVVDDGRTNPGLLGLNGPFLFIQVTSESPEEAQRIVVDAQERMRQELARWQASLGAPETTFVGLVDVVSPSTPEADRSQATRFGAMAVTFGFMLCLGIAYLAERVRARRRARAAVAVKVTPKAEPTRGVVRTRPKPGPSSKPGATQRPTPQRTPRKQPQQRKPSEPVLVSVPQKPPARLRSR